MTSHAAVVARGWGKCCVAGAGALEIDEKNRKVTIEGKKYGPKSVLSIDGSTGEVITPSAEAQPAQDPVERMKKLKAMHEAGLITDDEFNTTRARILAEM